MGSRCKSSLLMLLLLLVATTVDSWVSLSIDNPAFSSSTKLLRKSVLRSPAFELAPGEVSNKFYRIDFPKGHLSVRGFNAEIVDEAGVSVPLSEVYMHHWTVFNKNVKSGDKENKFQNEAEFRERNALHPSVGGNSVCHHGDLRNFWGLGSETRHTNTSIPPPYAMVVGDPGQIPHGFEEVWELNLHAIDTRGVEDRLGCTECRCSLYNVTADEHDQALPEGYLGGLRCCYDGRRCRLKYGFEDVPRTRYLQYTIHWVEWDEHVIPVKSYIFDVTNTGSGCKVEYNVPACDLSTKTSLTECVDARETTASLPDSGELIYVVGHQHAGGQGASLYGKNGQEICKSLPRYGLGSEAGDEAGYVVGMSACYPEPRKMKLHSQDILRLQSNYSSSREHTGVMGIFYLLVAPDRYDPLSITR
ncbi:hypothetical protein O6H91_16G056600 [Diphasiastrum complanatum]|uniref:Uncharacterized protein n=1 Tax=Diphasiastrum complanatum TaxID=34168 RepID=A0ACC2BCH2_DIPCM|nr:hypothetical protein O6H91_16G056600 [Diphasiastrum complanatum]